MRKAGLWVSLSGVGLSFIGTLLLLLHVTSKYHAAIQDMGSIAVGYLGLSLLGIAVSISGCALVLSRSVE